MINLVAPNLEPDNIDQYIVCIRPKRLGGARIEQERLGDKLVIHNYGHGGFGWTLLPGSVQHALELFGQAVKLEPLLAISKKVTVLGAGCMGLLTAILLQERGWDVTIVAAQTEQLTSHKASGALAVIAIKASAQNQALMDQVAVDSYAFYKELACSAKPKFLGVMPLPVYMIHEGTPDYRYPLIAAGVMPEPEHVMITFDNKVSYKAKKFDTFFFDTNVLMQEFAQKIIAYKIPVVKQKILDFTQLEDTLIFNCSGLGSRVWDAQTMLPVQGHLVRVKNQPPESHNYIIFAHIKIDGKLREISWTPNGGGMLGGSVVNGEERIEVNKEIADAIVNRARIFFAGH